MIILCKKHPQLYVYDLGVRFKNGRAEVDKKTATKLMDMKGYCFEEALGESPAEGENDSGS